MLDGNTLIAVQAQGDTLVVRNNVISNTGGSSNPVVYGAIAVSTYGSSFVSTRDNVIVNTFGAHYAHGICCGQGQHDRNLLKIGHTNYAANRGGIRGDDAANTSCRDNTVFDSTPGEAFLDCTQVGHNFSSP